MLSTDRDGVVEHTRQVSRTIPIDLTTMVNESRRSHSAMFMLASPGIASPADGLLLATTSVVPSIAAHPLVTAAMYLTIYWGLMALRSRLQVAQCTSRPIRRGRFN